MDKQRQDTWQQILQMTQQMRELAVPNKSLADLSIDEEYAKQPWLAITELESTRSGLLNEFFSIEASAEDAVKIAEGISQIQALDKELFIISQNIQKEIGATFSKLGHAQRAVSAYSSNAES
ncbi:MAG: flagellar protein FliT [Gammaproteobacteria bacterium]|nr:flagellar protein FliT [Gammaproteobacteria bacterium]